MPVARNTPGACRRTHNVVQRQCGSAASPLCMKRAGNARPIRLCSHGVLQFAGEPPNALSDWPVAGFLESESMIMAAAPSPLQNHILEALPSPVRERLFPHLKLITLPRSAVLYEAGAPLRQVYFPTDCIVSLLYVLENGASAEISVVGNEGAIGVSMFIGGETT